MSQKAAYLKELQTRLDKLQGRINQLKDKAEHVQAEKKIELYEYIVTLRAKQDVAKEKMLELNRAEEDTWDELKSGVEKAWNELGDAVHSAYEKFK